LIRTKDVSMALVFILASALSVFQACDHGRTDSKGNSKSDHDRKNSVELTLPEDLLKSLRDSPVISTTSLALTSGGSVAFEVETGCSEGSPLGTLVIEKFDSPD